MYTDIVTRYEQNECTKDQEIKSIEVSNRANVSSSDVLLKRLLPVVYN